MNLENNLKKSYNDKDSWEWHLTFIGQMMQHNYYLYYTIDQIMLNNDFFKGIVEIGTGNGALTAVLGLWAIQKDIPILTVDHKKMFNTPIFEALNIKYLQEDEFGDVLRTAVKLFIKAVKGPVFFICDGGNKIDEFNYWAPLLPSGSIIAAHDWTTEIDMKSIKDTVDKYCTPYNSEGWNKMNIQFATFTIK